MKNFIKLNGWVNSLSPITRPIYLDCGRIEALEEDRYPGTGYSEGLTYVTMSSGDTFRVKETSEEIMERLDAFTN